MKRFLAVRVSALPTYAEGLPLAGNGVILSDGNEKALLYLSPPPHFMRDFLCFGEEDGDEGVPCGSRV